MRLITFLKDGLPSLGGRLKRNDDYVDLSRAAPSLPRDLAVLLRRGDALVAAEAAIRGAPQALHFAADDVTLLPPLANPSKIICLGLNYTDHAAEGGHAAPKYPALFLRAASSLVPHGQPIRRPKVSSQLDYEAELVAIVGRTARHTPEGEALSFVAGYSIFNDASVRDYQRLSTQWTIGKNFDATGGFGPEFVTADELPPGAEGLRITSRLNGQIMQDANTQDMIFGVAKTLSLVSQCMTLEPGDLLVMGTPSGVGYARHPPVWMKHGDVCEVEIEGIGTLRNRIADEVIAEDHGSNDGPPVKGAVSNRHDVIKQEDIEESVQSVT